MFAQQILDVIKLSISQTEIDTTRAIADRIRRLPAGFPPSELADTLDAIASERERENGRLGPPPDDLAA